MSEPIPTGKECCSICGLDWSQAHWAFGRLFCEKFWSGRAPAKAMPPTPAQTKQIEMWIRPPAQPAARTQATLGRILP
jgi:hypothetical protein